MAVWRSLRPRQNALRAPPPAPRPPIAAVLPPSRPVQARTLEGRLHFGAPPSGSLRPRQNAPRAPRPTNAAAWSRRVGQLFGWWPPRDTGEEEEVYTTPLPLTSCQEDQGAKTGTSVRLAARRHARWPPAHRATGRPRRRVARYSSRQQWSRHRPLLCIRE
eukprot:scaffold68343_cov63-Phaeocystis_antarctica.AAC.1